jgi:superfamily II DNA or RNA helicase
VSLFSVGNIVRCREREWVILPSPSPEILLLRPLTGSEEEECGIYLPLARLGLDRVEPASFPLPSPDEVSDAVGVELLYNAARLSLRDGAGPFRSLGRISVRPRAYQFVPLLMALRLDPVRLLIADDVGVGKTIEALLIARELLDRGEIRRVCVLCPPYLCDQWEQELREKFHIEAVVVRSGTVSRLERDLPPGDHSIFGEHYPHLVVSIDYVKSERHRDNFLYHCPEFVIVDEAHGAARPGGASRAQQQRHDLLCRLAEKPGRHLILLTATPHSGIEESFLSLLALLNPKFARFDMQRLEEGERVELARHFVQRRRPDIARWLGEETPFPARESVDETYNLSPRYYELFEKVYQFGRELVRTGATLAKSRQRLRYWAALSLLRCVMSSPAAASAALRERARKEGGSVEEELVDELFAPSVYDPTDTEPTDHEPAHAVEESEADLGETGRRQLRRFAQMAEELAGTDADTKVVRCAAIVAALLQEGYHPIVWCRYIATSEYVAAELQRRLKSRFPDLQVFSVTGTLPEEDRRARVEELARFPRRVLVATDCLSEGINLQEHFTAVLHYDLPWNPNRLEQREGRVDRFGQTAKKVKAVLFYGKDNPVDGAVLDVLLRKAKVIYQRLGVSVPVPADSETVLEAIFNALFSRAASMKEHRVEQLQLFEEPTVRDFHRRWDEAARREKETQTRFAQRAIKPEEVERELRETDAVLGDPGAVARFVLSACQRLNLRVERNRDGTITIQGDVPASLKDLLPARPVTFNPPAPEGAEYLGRNHPFVAALARYLLEAALTQGSSAPATRCGVIKTAAVARRTVLLLLRLRYLLAQPEREKELLAEEVVVAAFQGFPPDRLTWLGDTGALGLLENLHPDAAITSGERREVLSEVLGWWPELRPGLERLVTERARKLEDAHRRVRAAAHLARRGLAVRPQFPPDLIGLLILLPVPKGVKR